MKRSLLKLQMHGVGRLVNSGAFRYSADEKDLILRPFREGKRGFSD
jgi:hypothetical protein